MRFLASLSFIALFGVNAFGQSDRSSSSDVTICDADVRWLNTNGSVNYRRSSEVPAYLSFLVHLSHNGNCSSGEVTLTATYLTEDQDFICSGTVRQAMTVSSAVQTFNMSIRPFMQLDFVRWRNQPNQRGEQPGKRLVCLNVVGTSDVGDAERQKAGWMRLSLSVAPSAGGLAVSEAVFRLVA